MGRIWRLGQKHKVEVYSLVAAECIESRIEEILATKQATFRTLFDGTSDEVKFERAGGFLAVARSVAVPVHGESAAGNGRAGKQQPEAKGKRKALPAVVVPEETSGETLDAVTVREPLAAADAAARTTPVPRAPADDDGERQPRARLDSTQVRSLLAGLTVQPRADGGMVLEADRESAAVLAEVLRGLAGVIEGAVRGGT